MQKIRRYIAACFIIKTVRNSLLLLTLFYARNLHSQPSDSAYIGTLYQKGWNYLYTDPDSASWFFEKGKAESENRKYFRGLITYYNYNAALQISLGRNQKAIDHYDEAIVIACSFSKGNFSFIVFEKSVSDGEPHPPCILTTINCGIYLGISFLK